MGVLCEFDQALCLWKTTGSQEINLNTKISREVFRDSPRRGQRLFHQPLTNLSMNETFQAHG
jgi:hypothetical protein